MGLQNYGQSVRTWKFVSVQGYNSCEEEEEHCVHPIAGDAVMKRADDERQRNISSKASRDHLRNDDAEKHEPQYSQLNDEANNTALCKPNQRRYHIPRARIQAENSRLLHADNADTQGVVPSEAKRIP